MKFLYLTVLLCLLAASVLSETTTTPGSPTTTDNTTTTTGSTTTPGPTTTTEPVTTPTTPTTTTTAAPPVPTTGSFNVSKDGSVCLRVVMSAYFTVQYEKKDKKKGIARVPIPADAKVTGMCAMDGFDPYMKLNFANGMVQMNFTQMEGKAYISSVSFAFDETDKKVFPDAAKPAEKHTATNEDFNMTLSKNETYYACNTKDSHKIDNVTNLTFDEIKVQAYSVKGDFSGTGEVCAGDKTTTETPKTTTPVTPTPGPTPAKPTPGNWSVKGEDGKVCIRATMGGRFQIPYVTKDNKNETATFDIPTKASASGSCSNMTDDLVLTFDKNTLTFAFTMQKSTALLAASNEYYLENVTFTYYPVPPHFKNAKADPKKALTVGAYNKSWFKADVGQSYLCHSKVDIALNNGAHLTTNDLQVQAFKTSNSTFDTYNQCAADGTSGIVPIAVGAALAALVVIVLIAYIIGRRKRYQGYEAL